MATTTATNLTWQYGDYVSKYTGPKWLMTPTSLEFDMPFTGERYLLGPWFTGGITLGASLLFVFLILFIAPLTKPSDKAVQKKIEFWHFFWLFVFSAIACGGTIYLMASRGEFTDFEGYLCNPVPDWYRTLSILFTLVCFLSFFQGRHQSVKGVTIISLILILLSSILSRFLAQYQHSVA